MITEQNTLWNDICSKDRKRITSAISKLAEQDLLGNGDTRIYWAKEVTFDYSTNHAIRIDYVKFKPLNNTAGGIEKGDLYCYEIKSSVEDFTSKHGHNLIGDLNYYIMPREVFDEVQTKIPFYVGVYCPEQMLADTQVKLVSARKAHRTIRSRSTAEILLMMFRSANRENIKNRKNKKKENEE